MRLRTRQQRPTLSSSGTPRPAQFRGGRARVCSLFFATGPNDLVSDLGVIACTKSGGEGLFDAPIFARVKASGSPRARRGADNQAGSEATFPTQRTHHSPRFEAPEKPDGPEFAFLFFRSRQSSANRRGQRARGRERFSRRVIGEKRRMWFVRVLDE